MRLNRDSSRLPAEQIRSTNRPYVLRDIDWYSSVYDHLYGHTRSDYSYVQQLAIETSLFGSIESYSSDE